MPRLAVVLVLLSACGPRAGASRDLLAGRLPHKTIAVKRAELLTDRVIAVAGDPATSHLAVLIPPGGLVEYDLGTSRTIRGAYVQADNNDEYVLSVSEDGSAFWPLWVAPPVGGAGLRSRIARGLEAHGRYVRLTATGGDRVYTVTELALYEEEPPSQLDFAVRRGMPVEELVRSSILLFGLALVGCVLLARRGSRVLTLIALALPAGAAWHLVYSFWLVWPIGQREMAMLRSTLALVTLVALAREVLVPRRFPPNRAVVLGTLGFCAALAMASFFNLGHPQFWDAKRQRPNLVHNHDLRAYYPAAKYFRELGYDGVYLASVAAYIDDVPGASPSILANVSIRDLKTHEMRRVADLAADMEAVRRRFTPEKWRALVEDMRYFRETMGERDYIGSMSDHGANATPVWLAIAHLIFARTHASNATLTVTALLDPLLLLCALIAMGWAFGIRTAFVCAVVFGTNDFYMFGSSWTGATLRYDWLAYAAFGICALHRRYWRAGGALLALSALIRAFPLLALLGAGLPALWWLVDRFRANRKLPTWQELRLAHRPLFAIALGAVLSVAALLLLTLVLFPLSAWPQWLHKAALLDSGVHVNHISLRALVAGNDALQRSTLLARLPLFIALIGFFVALVLLASRGKSYALSALLGLLLLPVVFNPANYYIHFIFLFPLLVPERTAAEIREGAAPLAWTDFLVWAVLLGLCVLLYWTVLAPNWELHFDLDTVFFFTTLTAILVTIAARDAAAGSARRAVPVSSQAASNSASSAM
ncbi:MAG TPA: hypothetical protein VKN99_15135 [Polyangia bacterium]|nr:hypothetical protein [Polyangia bacterium]